MDEKIVFKTYNSLEADLILAAFQEAGIPAYKREHGIGQLVEIAAGMSHTSLIDIIIPEEAEEEADEILMNMGLLEPPNGKGHADINPEEEDTPRGKAALLDDFAMEYETAVIYLDADNYLEQFYDLYFFKNRSWKLIPAEESFQGALDRLCGEDDGKLIAEKTESLFGLPKHIMVFDEVAELISELEACSDGWGPFYIVFDLIFCEYEEYTLCFITGTNN